MVLEHDHIIAADFRAVGAPVFEHTSTDENQSASSALVGDFRGHQAVLEDFFAAIDQNRTPACDGREGRRSLAVIGAIWRGSTPGVGLATGRRVTTQGLKVQTSQCATLDTTWYSRQHKPRRNRGPFMRTELENQETVLQDFNAPQRQLQMV